MNWRIEIPEEKIELKVEALLTDQEMISGGINYWEGPISTTGLRNGKIVKGQGFMELVGYASDYNALFLAGNELRKKIAGGLLDRFASKK